MEDPREIDWLSYWLKHVSLVPEFIEGVTTMPADPPAPIKPTKPGTTRPATAKPKPNKK